MSLNLTGIEYADFTHNIVTGCWGPGGSKYNPCHCPFCFAKRFAERFFPYGFVPTFHPDRIPELYKLKAPKNYRRKRKSWIAKAFPDSWLIFEVDMGDAFGDSVPDSWTGNLLFTIANCPQHIFLLLTKNAKNLLKWDKFYPPNLFLGVSITRQHDIERIFYLKATSARIKFVSFEPLLGPINTNLDGIDWLIIGSQTRPTKTPKKEWVQTLLGQARDLNIPIFLKDNLYFESQIREFPTSRSSE